MRLPIRAVSVLVTLFVCLPYAETLLRYKRSTEPSASTSDVTAWIGANKAVYSDEGYRSILTFSTNTLTIIDSAEKAYTVIQCDSIRSTVDQMIKANTEDAQTAAAMKAMMEGMMGSALQGAMTVTNTGEKRKIGSWDCTRYTIAVKMAVGPTTSEAWITDQIKIDAKKFNLMKNGMMALLPGFDRVALEVEKIKGVPVKTISSYEMLNSTVTTTETLVECSEIKAPEGIFSVPKGYTKQSLTGD